MTQQEIAQEFLNYMFKEVYADKMADIIRNQLLFGTTSIILPRFCCLCKDYDFRHEKLDHPCFYSNLEYLEWEATKRGI